MDAEESLYLTDREKEIVREFCYLLDKSRQLFNGLRNIESQDGKSWMPYFFRTFEVFTKLWKFQQENRTVLNTCYGLSRWQIGEIASKIGQLYYHYYIRTSNTAYLLETFAFYLAIRSRQYFSTLNVEERPELIAKKLRYYARFIMVCLLLKKMKQARDLIKEMTRLVEDYVQRYDADDQMAWSLVLTEVKTFIEADNVVCVVDVDSSAAIVSGRLSTYSLPLLDKAHDMGFCLTEAVIVGFSTSQVTFGEFTLDMYWMLQVLERELHDDFLYSTQRVDCSPAPGKCFGLKTMNDCADSDNPRKSLLFKPTFDQLLKHLCNCYDQLSNGCVLLIYLSGDSSVASSESNAANSEAHKWEGLMLNSHLAEKNIRDPAEPSTTGVCLNAQCLYPADFFLFMRKPLVLIIDANSSSDFLSMDNQFCQPVIILCSPVEMPSYLQERPQRGSLFTLFLHCPLTAVCYICNISRLPVGVWDRCQAMVDKFYCEAGRLLIRSRRVDMSYRTFFSDIFLRAIILRFLFCLCTLRMHRSFREDGKYLPHSKPSFDDTELVEHPTLQRLVVEIACALDVTSAFRDDLETVC